MANNFLKHKDFTSSDITDVTSATDSIDSRSESAPNFLLQAVNEAASSDLYYAFNGTVSGLKRRLTLHYDFATDGGAIGTVTLRGGALPDNAIIDRAWYEVTTTFTSATDAATIGLGVATDDATGIVAATAISGMGNIWDAGIQAAIDPSTVADFTTKTTAARDIIATVAVEDLTAGALVLHIEYSVSEVDTTI